MYGIDINKPMVFKHSSFRYFAKNEWHVTRVCKDDVLLLVFEGVLRFQEDGIYYEVHPGEYHIQKHHSFQKGYTASDSPKYLYVHFLGEWSEEGERIAFRGEFDMAALMPLMTELDNLSHTSTSLLHKSAKFMEIMVRLCPREQLQTTANQIAALIGEADLGTLSLDQICKQVHFSKNHVISLFKKAYGMTPIRYINQKKLQRAEYLLEATSDTLESIANACGFRDYSHFYRLFVREKGMPPAQWRNQKQIHPASEH